jgi:hypothetical protein
VEIAILTSDLWGKSNKKSRAIYDPASLRYPGIMSRPGSESAALKIVF